MLYKHAPKMAIIKKKKIVNNEKKDFLSTALLHDYIIVIFYCFIVDRINGNSEIMLLHY
jgi:hypothetical protein